MERDLDAQRAGSALHTFNKTYTVGDVVNVLVTTTPGNGLKHEKKPATLISSGYLDGKDNLLVQTSIGIVRGEAVLDIVTPAPME